MTFKDLLPPNELSILAGASGAGKSTLCVQAIAQWSRGLPFLGVTPDSPQCIGYVVADRGEASLLDHARRANTHFNKDLTISLIDDVDFSLSRFKADPLQTLLEFLDRLRNRGAKIIIVDPVMVFLGVDLNRYHLVAPELIRLNRYAKEHGITLLGIHHTTKARSDFAFLRPQDRISGSSALSAFTSTQWALWSPEELPEEEREAGLTRLDVIAHTAAPVTLYLKRNDNGVFDGKLHQPRAARQDDNLEARIMDVLAEGNPVRANLLIEAVDAEPSSVYFVLDRLLNQKRVERPARGFWQLSGR